MYAPNTKKVSNAREIPLTVAANSPLDNGVQAPYVSPAMKQGFAVGRC